MKADVFDTEKFIKINNLKEVSNPIIFDRGMVPTSDGLLSTEIFGRTTDDRKLTWAYIDLKEHFFHPLIYKTLKRLDRRIEKIISGQLKVKVVNGELVEDEENGETGINFLYKNIKKIKYFKNYSTMRNERVDLISKLSINELFMRYTVVIPAFYRDVLLDKMDKGKVSCGEINDLYVKIIRLSKSLQNDYGIDLVGNMTRMRIQTALIDIYDNLTKEIKGKNGIFRQSVMGKSVDYGVRAVISSSQFHAEKYNEMDVDFYKCGLPLAMCCTTFFPFVLRWVKNFFHDEIYLRQIRQIKDENGNIKKAKITNVNELCNDEYITKSIDLFIHSYTDRFKKIPIKMDDGKTHYMKIAGYYADSSTKDKNRSSSIFSRHTTWTDILYLACVDVCKDKHVVITRYPLEDYFGIFPNRITVMGTVNTVPVIINDKVYSNYPIVDFDADVDKIRSMFVDTLNISNLYLNGLGGDYDGDQVSIRGVFFQESNKELEELMFSKQNILNIYGSNVRETAKEGLQTIYNLTKIG